MRSRANVVLPEPEPPMRTHVSPRSMSRSMPSSTTFPSYSFTSPRTSMSAGAMPPSAHRMRVRRENELVGNDVRRHHVVSIHARVGHERGLEGDHGVDLLLEVLHQIARDDRGREDDPSGSERPDRIDGDVGEGRGEQAVGDEDDVTLPALADRSRALQPDELGGESLAGRRDRLLRTRYRCRPRLRRT